MFPEKQAILVDADMKDILCGCQKLFLWMLIWSMLDFRSSDRRKGLTLCLSGFTFIKPLRNECGSCALLLTTLCKLGSQMKEGSCISVILWGWFLPSKVLQVEKRSGAIMSEE